MEMSAELAEGFFLVSACIISLPFFAILSLLGFLGYAITQHFSGPKWLAKVLFSNAFALLIIVVAFLVGAFCWFYTLGK